MTRRRPAHPAPEAPSRDWRSDVLSAVVVGAVVFNFLLCFVNTNVFRTSTGLVRSSQESADPTTDRKIGAHARKEQRWC